MKLTGTKGTIFWILLMTILMTFSIINIVQGKAYWLTYTNLGLASLGLGLWINLLRLAIRRERTQKTIDRAWETFRRIHGGWEKK